MNERFLGNLNIEMKIFSSRNGEDHYQDNATIIFVLMRQLETRYICEVRNLNMGSIQLAQNPENLKIPTI